MRWQRGFAGKGYINAHRQAALHLQLVHIAVCQLSAIFHRHHTVGVPVQLGKRVGAQQHGCALGFEFMHNLVEQLARGGV